MKALITILSLILICIGFKSEAQSRDSTGNVGIGTNEPREPLEVVGMVFSSQDGFKFPDGSVQSRAYSSYSAEDAGDHRWIIIMDVSNVHGSFQFPPEHNDVIRVIDFSWGMYHAFDETTGQMDGGKRHNLITVKKDIDKASTQLAERFKDATLIDEIELYFYKEDTAMQQMDWYYKILFENCFIGALYQSQVYRGGETYSHIEEVLIKFHEYTIEWRDGSLNAHGFWYGNPR